MTGPVTRRERARGLLLGLDIGTTSAKAIAFTLEGEPVAEGSSGGYPVHRQRLDGPGENIAEQAPADWWQAAREALRQALAGLDAPILAVGTCGTQPGAVVVGPDGEPEPRGIIWQDGRAFREAEWLAAHVGEARLSELVGIRLPISGALPPARLVWFGRHRPEVLDGRHRIVQPKDTINRRLTGTWSTDITSSLGVLNLKTRRIEPAYAALLGFPPEILPPAFDAFQPVGRVTPAAAAETGLPAGIPVVAGWIDAWAGMFGTGLGAPGVAFDVAGTSEIVGLTAREPEADPRGLLSIPIIGDLHTVYGLTNSGADSLRWFVEGFIDPSLSADAFATFEREAASVPAGAGGLLFLPYLYGERTPVWDEQVRGSFIGVDRLHARPHFGRAVIEGLGHCVRQILDLAAAVGRRRPDRIRASSGGARNPVVNQVKADIAGMPVETLKVNETAALGAAMLAAMGIGAVASHAEAVARMVHVAGRFEPDPATRAVYDRAHALYGRLYPAIAPLR